MKRRMLTVVTLAVLRGLVVAGEASANTQSSNDRIIAEIKSLENARLAAGLRKDVEAVSAMTAEDYLQVLDGKEFKGAVRYTRIYVKRDGRWQVVLFQQTRVVDDSVTSVSSAAAQEREGVMGDLLRDVGVIETKIVGLADAMPTAIYEWRPGAGVRSAGEVLLHVAGDNYFLPALMGVPAPVDTGIDGKDNKTVAAFEARRLTRNQIIVELRKSFAFLKSAMHDTTDATLEMAPRNSVRKTTTRATWIATVTHLHEHLGQLIAYARSNSITPPWSK